MTNPVVAIEGLTKRFGASPALRNVDLAIAEGEVHALLGGNGSGKSTLIKLLAGVHGGDAGTIRVRNVSGDAHRWGVAQARAAGVHVVHQDPAVFADRSVAENLALGRSFERTRAGRIRWTAQLARADAVLQRVGVDIDPRAPVGSLGPAKRTMVAIARALQDDDGSGVLVLDEPTASLPAAEVALLLDLMRARSAAGQTVVFVSHRLGEVFQIADTITVLRDGQRVATQPAASLDEHTLVDLMVGHHVAPASPSTTTLGPVRLRVQALAAGPLAGIDLDVRAGEVVGIAGLLGSGRSTLLRAVFGDIPRTGVVAVDGVELTPGSIRAAMRNGVSLVPEDRSRDALFRDHSVRSNVTAASVAKYSRRGLLNHGGESRDAQRWIGELAIAGPGERAPVGALSGGNQQKVVLARWLQRNPAVILLDEPTQGVDTAARATLHRHIRAAADAGSAVLMTSSDLDELSERCDRVAVLAEGRVATVLASAAATPAAIVAATVVVTEPTTTDGAA